MSLQHMREDLKYEQEQELAQVAWRFMRRREKERKAQEAKARAKAEKAIVKAERERLKAEKKAAKAQLRTGDIKKGTVYPKQESGVQMAEEGQESEGKELLNLQKER
ncbi:hypothetical protein Pcinc_037592 [Petrolisthes cinctipes]|uniref:Uncharacterized protein n=1 Tax=Petrolisthes cinctipes TaxID=88211 RepID=A0AAE1BVN8_PETCI|nr:hypothetical protein Pcinc_037592 [Petrolisthes cinctipes]